MQEREGKKTLTCCLPVRLPSYAAADVHVGEGTLRGRGMNGDSAAGKIRKIKARVRGRGREGCFFPLSFLFLLSSRTFFFSEFAGVFEIHHRNADLNAILFYLITDAVGFNVIRSLMHGL